MAFAAAVAMVSQGANASAERWLRGDEAYAANHYAAALEIYVQLAESGDPRAAELAGHMFFIGERLYGNQVERDPGRAFELLMKAKRAGRPIAGYLLEHAAASTNTSKKGKTP